MGMSTREKIQHICIADDDPDDFYIFSKILREIDSDIRLSWFQTCIDLLEFLKEGNSLPELVLLDMNMPKVDGQACLVSIKKEAILHHIPVIIFSTAISPTSINIAYQAGAFKYYQKPFALDEYRNLIREMLATFSA